MSGRDPFYSMMATATLSQLLEVFASGVHRGMQQCPWSMHSPLTWYYSGRDGRRWVGEGFLCSLCCSIRSKREITRL